MIRKENTLGSSRNIAKSLASSENTAAEAANSTKFNIIYYERWGRVIEQHTLKGFTKEETEQILPVLCAHYTFDNYSVEIEEVESNTMED